jgi:hypothetical protein
MGAMTRAAPCGYHLAPVSGVIVADRAGSAVGNYSKTSCVASTSSPQVKPYRSVQFPEPKSPVILQLADLRRKSRQVWQPTKPVENFFVLPPGKELFFSGKSACPNHQVRFDQPFVEIEFLCRSNST